MYKDTELMRFTGAGWEVVGRWKGHAQRNRIVHMASAAVNRGLRPLFDYWHEARRNIKGLWHVGDRDITTVRGFKYMYECDISGFDVSVTREIQVATGWHDARARPALSNAINFWLKAETLPMITPAWDRSHGACQVLTFEGGTRSGFKVTAEAGCRYSLDAALLALAQQGFNVFAWPWSNEFALLIQGDDVLVCTNKPLNSDAWAASYEAFGLKAELLQGDMFLSRHHSDTPTPFPLASRIIQQTLSNEHEPTGEPSDIEGLLILGFIARTEHASRLPEQLRREAALACIHAAWTQKFIPASKCGDIDTMRTHLLTSTQANQAIHTALAAAANLPWLLQEYRDREHSPAAALISTFIDKHRPELLLEPTSQDIATREIIDKMLQLPIRNRLLTATELATILLTSRDDADLKFNQLAMEVL
jgi:hypothetical protein